MLNNPQGAEQPHDPRTTSQEPLGALDEHLAKAAEKILVLLGTDEPEERVKRAVTALLDQAATTGEATSDNNRHVLCEMFEQFAVAINVLLETPDAVIDAIINQVTADWVSRAVFRVVLKQLVSAALRLDPNAVPLKVLYLKACLLAVSICPNDKDHLSLEKNCVFPLMKDGINQNGEHTNG
jgi:hypothetical protein